MREDEGGNGGSAQAARARRPARGPRSLTASEAAALIGVSVATVRGWADQGRLPSHRTPGGHRRFDVEELRGWLARRGAPVPDPADLRPAPPRLPPCPGLARALNARTEAIVERVLAGYDDRVTTPLPRPSDPELRRVTVRFLRVVAAALDTGRSDALAGRAELAGFRGGLEGPAGVRVVAEHARVAAAIAREAEEALAEGAVAEEASLACLLAVVDDGLAAVARGFEQAGRRAGKTSP